MTREEHIINDNSASQKSVLILFQDSALCVFSSILALLMVRWVSEPAPGFTFVLLKWAGLSLVASLAGILICSSHKVVRRWATVKSTSRLIWAILVKELLLVASLAFSLIELDDLSQMLILILADTLFTAGTLLYLRFAARMFASEEKADMKTVVARKNILVYGTDDDAVLLAKNLIKSGEYNVLGYMTDDKAVGGSFIAGLEAFYCVTRDDIESLEWKLGGVDFIYLPKGSTDQETLDKYYGMDENPQDQIDGTVSFKVAANRMLKRSFDIVLSGILLIVFSPLALAIAVAILLEDGEDPIYKQQRVGLNGKPFSIYKFRSMRTDAEAFGAQLYSGEDDPRLTKVGAFIRRHHLDELPQLWNVFVGDMSFVGYRPERPYYIKKIMEQNPRYRYLYQIRPGVTSYATLYNGYTDTLEKMLTRLDLDLYYLRNHSVAFDLKVLGLTFLSIVGGKKF